MIRTPQRTARRAHVAAGLALALLCLVACSAPSSPRAVTLAPGADDRAFDAAREVLLEAGFTLERVDAQAGVITTRRKFANGLINPWEPEQQSLGQEWRDLLNRNSRRVLVRFEPAAFPDHTGVETPISDATREAVFEVYIDRRQSPGLRVETESISASSYWVDPSLPPRGLAWGDDVPRRHDHAFAAELARRFKARLDAPVPHTDPETELQTAPETTTPES